MSNSKARIISDVLDENGLIKADALSITDESGTLGIPAVDGLQGALDGKVDVELGKGLSTEDYTTAEKNKLSGIEAGAEVNTVTSVAGKSGAVTLNKSDVGLGNVDNTSDLSKPISTATQSALDAKVAIADIVNNLTSNNTDKPLSANQGLILKGFIDNINAVLQSDDTTLDELQEIVDFIKQNRQTLDALGISNIAGLQAALDTKVDKITGKGLSTEDYTTAEKNKLAGIQAGAQVNVGTNLGSSGTGGTRTITSSTGSNTSITYTKGDIGLGNVDNTSDANKPISTATQSALDAKENTFTKNTAFNKNFGTAADTVTQGNDSRLSNSREWTASTVSQAEAEAGTATTRRAFTAQRVFQAIVAWWNGSSDKSKLDGIEAGAQVNVGTNLGQGGSGNSRTITSSTGSNVTVSTATTSNAGFMSTGDKSKLDGIAAGAQVNVATNLSSSGTGATRTIASSTGTNASITYSAADVGAVPTGRTLTAGTGLSGGGNLTANRTLAVDSTVVRTSGNQTIGGTKTFSAGRINSPGASSHNHGSISISGSKSSYAGIAFPDANAVFMVRNSDARSGVYVNNNTWRWYFDGAGALTVGTVPWARLTGHPTITAGTGLSGGGNLTANRTLTVDSSVVRTSGNQTLAGTKTFTGIPVFGTLRVTELSKQGSASGTSFYIQDNNGTRVFRIQPNAMSLFSPTVHIGTNSNVSTGRALEVVGNMGLTGTLQSGTIPWARLSEIPPSATRGEISAANIANTSGVAVGFITGRRMHHALTSSSILVRTSGNQTIGGNKRFSGFTGFGVAPSTSYRIYSRSSGNAAYIRTNSTSSSIYALRVRTGANSTALTVMGNARVGVGTASPSQALHVIGQILASDNITAYSDINLKDNIETIPDAINKVSKINGVTYTRNDQKNKESRHAGVIAQEVEAVLPEVVETNQDGIKSVAYGNMVGLLVEAIKEQQGQIEELKSEINILKGKSKWKIK